MTPAETPSPNRLDTPSLRQRLYADVSRTGVAIVLGLAFIFAFGREVNESLVSMRDGHFARGWSASAASSSARH